MSSPVIAEHPDKEDETRSFSEGFTLFYSERQLDTAIGQVVKPSTGGAR
jgi:hypothetical protein